MRIVVTGANGFIGQHLCPYLRQHLGSELVTLTRSLPVDSNTSLTFSASDTDLIPGLTDVDCVIHLAARAHTSQSTTADFERDNLTLSSRVARLCIAANVPRLIYLSSIKVNGNSTSGRGPFSADEHPEPDDDYGKSKLASEEALKRQLSSSTTELVIIRPPLVYGDNNKGNLKALEKLIRTGMPLPFEGLENQRDLVSIDNLCALIALVINHPQAANQTFLVSDGVTRSTKEIVQLLARRQNKRVRFFKIPSWLFRVVAKIKPQLIERLAGNLQVDIGENQIALGMESAQLMSLLIVLFLTLFVFGYLLTKALIYYAHKKQLLDIANHRSSHTHATPRIGGLSFVLLISLIIFCYLFFITTSTTSIFYFILVPIIIVALTGLADDIKGLRQNTRFIVYFICALIAVGNLQSLFAQPYWVISIVGLLLSLGISWLINLFNFMDGIDGIAATEGIFVLAALAFFSYQSGDANHSYLLLLCAAPVAGFLVPNWQPAKIFMGDIGSTFLGCLIGCLCLYAINTNAINVYVAIILLGSFIVDATWTLTYRFFSGQKWYQAHRSHNYQILSRKFGSHQTVTILYFLINIGWLFPLALAANLYQNYALLITTISLLPLVLQCFIIGAGKFESN